MAAATTIAGIGVSEGIRIGRAYRLDEPVSGVSGRTAEKDGNAGTDRAQSGLPGGSDGPSRNAEAEIGRLEQARERCAEQLTALAERARAELGEDKAAILAGQRGFLSDPAFYPAIAKRVRDEGWLAEEAVNDTVEMFAAKFEALGNAYMRERAADIRDVGKRLLLALTGGGEESGLAGLREEAILVAEDLSPSETVQLDKRYVLAFVTRTGGKTSHTAILSRSLGIPAIVGAGEPLDAVRTGDTLIVDGANGLCIVRPDEETLRAYEVRMAEERDRIASEREGRFRPAVSADGRRVEIGVNIGAAAESEAAADSGADGIGLYRTEFLFMHAERLPDEEEQYAAYSEVVRRMDGRPVIIRTLDIGGDKALPYLNLPKEANPFLGYRAIRIGLDREDWLRSQLRAIIRASAHGEVKVMFPMISGLGEWRRAKALFEEELASLRKEGQSIADRIETGIMVEIPSAALLADTFAREVDFFSIGTNDLVQYTLAVDRMNEKVAPLYDYFHPAVLQLIQRVIEASHTHGKWTGMCGGMAADPIAAPLLLGYGLDEWSMDIGSIPKVKQALSRLDSGECREWAARLTALDTPEAVRSELVHLSERS
ncbi:phosphoenolpyruvate--protein phosphotransferase [Paenibacillus hodogayensis]|uniref:Phosphoenolpyruvate-protein phosphotransferase n=1 Tax=Paenibacillus hodogayensis TaxID=279208 RepID=A0ABV5VZK4_9BACL